MDITNDETPPDGGKMHGDLRERLARIVEGEKGAQQELRVIVALDARPEDDRGPSEILAELLGRALPPPPAYVGFLPEGMGNLVEAVVSAEELLKIEGCAEVKRIQLSADHDFYAGSGESAGQDRGREAQERERQD